MEDLSPGAFDTKPDDKTTYATPEEVLTKQTLGTGGDEEVPKGTMGRKTAAGLSFAEMPLGSRRSWSGIKEKMEDNVDIWSFGLVTMSPDLRAEENKGPDWVDLPEGGDLGDMGRASGLAGLPIPEGCLSVSPLTG